MTKPRIAIIGAGISGLTLAGELCQVAEITIFEKSRGVGGRMATRRAEIPGASGSQTTIEFDHGTQFFTAKSTEFQNYLAPLIQQGLIAEWQGKVMSIEAGRAAEERPWLEPHYVAVPAMNSFAKHLAQNLTIELSTQVARLPEQADGTWRLSDIEGHALGDFEWVISTAPPAQTISLFASHIPAVSSIAEVEMQGCYTLMLGFAQPWKGDWIAAKIRNCPVEWVAINSTKPSRNSSMTSIVVHSSNAWAQDRIDEDQEKIEAHLLDELADLKLVDVESAAYISMHRWRYALKPDKQAHSAAGPFVDALLGLASTGDWSSASRIEDVWLAARSLANDLRNHL